MSLLLSSSNADDKTKMEFIINTVNTSTAWNISVEKLIYWLKTPEIIDEYKPHLYSFFEKVPPEDMQWFCKKNNISLEQLAIAYKIAMQPYLPNISFESWINEQTSLENTS
ncbi:MAG: hypothetical protein ACLFN5_02205 [bacterium]